MEVELRVVVWSVRELVINGKSREIDAGGTADVLVTVQSSILLPPQESVKPNPSPNPSPGPNPNPKHT
jgi:hypothetical protein